MEKSLTEGNSLKQILYFAFPLLLGNPSSQCTSVLGDITDPNAKMSVVLIIGTGQGEHLLPSVR